MRCLIVALLASLAAACATTGATPRPFPAPSGPGPAAPAGSSPAAADDAISSLALSLRGTPYRNGGSDPSGFDCSGFVVYVFEQYGIALPRTVDEQFHAGVRVDATELRPGDLVFFDTSGASRRRATHVGIAIGGDAFVHAPSSKGEVRVERIGSSYWGPRFLEGRRVP